MYGTDKKGDLGTGTWFEGVIPNLQRRFENTESEWVKQRLHQYMSEQPCNVCNGTRLQEGGAGRAAAHARRLERHGLPTRAGDAMRATDSKAVHSRSQTKLQHPPSSPATRSTTSRR